MGKTVQEPLRRSLDKLIDDLSLDTPFGVVEVATEDMNGSFNHGPASPPNTIATAAELYRRAMRRQSQWLELIDSYSGYSKKMVGSVDTVRKPFEVDGYRVFDCAAYGKFNLTNTSAGTTKLNDKQLEDADQREPSNLIINCKGFASCKVFCMYRHDTRSTFDTLRNYLLKGGLQLALLDELEPSDDEMVPGVIYLDQRTGNQCRTRTKQLSGNVITGHRITGESSIPWQRLTFGESLADAIHNELDLRYGGQNVTEWPRNWKTSDLASDVPRYPGERESPYPHGAEKLPLDRWVFWNWQMERYDWKELEVAYAAKFGNSANHRRTLTRAAKRYADWIGMSKRRGKN